MIIGSVGSSDGGDQCHTLGYSRMYGRIDLYHDLSGCFETSWSELFHFAFFWLFFRILPISSFQRTDFKVEWVRIHGGHLGEACNVAFHRPHNLQLYIEH